MARCLESVMAVYIGAAPGFVRRTEPQKLRCYHVAGHSGMHFAPGLFEKHGAWPEQHPDHKDVKLAWYTDGSLMEMTWDKSGRVIYRMRQAWSDEMVPEGWIAVEEGA